MTRYKYTLGGYNRNIIRIVKDGDLDPFTGCFYKDFTYYVDKKSKPSKNQLNDLKTKGYCLGVRVDQFTVAFN